MITYIAVICAVIIIAILFIAKAHACGYNEGYERGVEMGQKIERFCHTEKMRSKRMATLKAPCSGEKINRDTVLSIYDEFKEKLERSAMELYLDTRKKFVKAEKEAIK